MNFDKTRHVMRFFLVTIVFFVLYGTGLYAEENSDVLKQANEFINKNQLQKSISLLEGVVENRKDLYEAFFLLGKSYYLVEEYVKAERTFLKGLELNKTFIPPYLFLANIYNKKEQYNDAEAILNKGIDQDPVNGILYAKLGEVLFKEKRNNDSVKAFLRSFEFDKTLASSINEAARIYINNQNYQLALDLLMRMIRQVPPGSEAEKTFKTQMNDCRYNIFLQNAEKLYAQKKYGAALPFYNEANQLDNSDKELGVKIASCQYAQGSVTKAEQSLDKVILEDPNVGSAWKLKAVIANDKHQLPVAETAILKAVELDATHSATFDLAGNIHEQLILKEKALKFYLQAIIIDENDAMAHFRAGYLQADANRYEESMRNLEIAQTLAPSTEKKALLQTVNSYYYIELGNKAFDAKKFKEAADYFSRSVQFKKNPAAIINQANALIEDGNFNDAIKLLESITVKKDKFLPAYESLGLAYQKTGRMKEAGEIYKQMQSAAKNDWSVYANSGGYYMRNGEYAKAITNYGLALKLSKNQKNITDLRLQMAKCQYSYGVEFYNKKMFDDAARCFTNTLTYDSTMADARIAMGRIKYARDMDRLKLMLAQASAFSAGKEYTKAADLYRRILEISDTIRSVKYNLAVCYYNLNNIDQAILLLKEYLFMTPDDTDATSLLAQIFIDRNDLPEAKALLISSINRGYESTKISFTLGSLYEKEGNSKDAELNYSQAVRFDPNNLDARISLGNLYYRRADYTKAQEQYENVLRLSPENDAAIYNLGFIYYKKNMIPEALAQFKQAEQYIKDYAPLDFNLARANFYAGNYSEAFKYAERTASQSSNISTLYSWGLANIYVKLFNVETAPQWKELYRQKAIKMCEECIYNHDNPEISMMARGKIVEVMPDKKYLYKASYLIDHVFSPEVIENSIYSFIERDNEFVKSYIETGEVIWRLKVKGKPSIQYKVGKNLYAAMDGEILIIDPIKGSEIGHVGISANELIPGPDGLLVKQNNGSTYTYFNGTKKEWDSTLPMVRSSTNESVFSAEQVCLCNSEKIISLNIKTGKINWEFSQPGSVHSYLELTKNFAVLEINRTGVHELACIGLKDGKKRWSSQLKDAFQIRPIADNTSVICFLRNNTVVKYDLEGRWLWTHLIPKQPVSSMIQNGAIYISMVDDLLVGLNLNTGAEVWKYTIDKEKKEPGPLCTLYYLEQ